MVLPAVYLLLILLLNTSQTLRVLWPHYMHGLCVRTTTRLLSQPRLLVPFVTLWLCCLCQARARSSNVRGTLPSRAAGARWG